MGNYAFIDSQNVHLAIRDQGWGLDWLRLRKFLYDKYRVTKAFIFIGFIARNEKLYVMLRSAGFILIFKPCVEYKDGQKWIRKGNVDAELVLQAMIEWKNYQKAVIASGDGDFCCLIRHLRKNEKLARVLVPNQRKFSSLLREFGGDITFINTIRVHLEKN